MVRVLLALVLAGLMISTTACTNTVRGLGADLNSPTMQNYNNGTAADADY